MKTIIITPKDKNYPNQICNDCGIEANRQTCLKKYGKEPTKKKFEVSTYHIAECQICGQKTFVTEARDFFYPDFKIKK